MTEWISNVNIPSCQLLIGMGIPLHRIPDIRRLFAKDPADVDPIDFDNEPQVQPAGALLRPLLQPTLSDRPMTSGEYLVGAGLQPP